MEMTDGKLTLKNNYRYSINLQNLQILQNLNSSHNLKQLEILK